MPVSRSVFPILTFFDVDKFLPVICGVKQGPAFGEKCLVRRYAGLPSGSNQCLIVGARMIPLGLRLTSMTTPVCPIIKKPSQDPHPKSTTSQIWKSLPISLTACTVLVLLVAPNTQSDWTARQSPPTYQLLNFVGYHHLTQDGFDSNLPEVGHNFIMHR